MLQSSAQHKGLGLGMAYEPRAKRRKPHSRKETLDLTPSDSIPSTTKQCERVIEHINHLEKKPITHKKTDNYVIDQKCNSQKAFVLKSNSNESKKGLNNNSFRTLLLNHQTDKGPLHHPPQLKNAFTELDTSGKQSTLNHVRPYVRTSNSNTRFNISANTRDTVNEYNSNVKKSPLNVNTVDIHGLSSKKEPSQVDTCINKHGHVRMKSKYEETKVVVTEESKRKAELYLQCRGYVYSQHKILFIIKMFIFRTR